MQGTVLYHPTLLASFHLAFRRRRKRNLVLVFLSPCIPILYSPTPLVSSNHPRSGLDDRKETQKKKTRVCSALGVYDRSSLLCSNQVEEKGMGSLRGRDREKVDARMFTQKGNLLVFTTLSCNSFVCLFVCIQVQGNLVILSALILGF